MQLNWQAIPHDGIRKCPLKSCSRVHPLGVQKGCSMTYAPYTYFLFYSLFILALFILLTSYSGIPFTLALLFQQFFYSGIFCSAHFLLWHFSILPTFYSSILSTPIHAPATHQQTISRRLYLHQKASILFLLQLRACLGVCRGERGIPVMRRGEKRPNQLVRSGLRQSAHLPGTSTRCS